jgi:hypothetical protein
MQVIRKGIVMEPEAGGHSHKGVLEVPAVVHDPFEDETLTENIPVLAVIKRDVPVGVPQAHDAKDGDQAESRRHGISDDRCGVKVPDYRASRDRGGCESRGRDVFGSAPFLPEAQEAEERSERSR